MHVNSPTILLIVQCKLLEPFFVFEFYKIRREEAEEAEEEVEVDEIYKKTIESTQKKIKEKTKEVGGADNEHLEKKMIEEKRKQKRAAKIAAWEKVQESKGKSS